MNDRIKELIVQCTSFNVQDGWFFDKEQFAVLIVKECAKTIEDAHSKDLGDYLKKIFKVE